MTCCFCIPTFRTCSPSEYLCITGLGIKSVKIVRSAWIKMGQTCTVLDISPQNYEFDINAMSSEMLPFLLPAVFTIGPKLNPHQPDDMSNLELYSALLSSHDGTTSKHVHTIIKGIVEGETRVLAAAMTMKQIFEGTKEFKQHVFEKVQLELNQFGLQIYNANIKQLTDLPGHEYFSLLGTKIQTNAANQAKIDKAEADRNGNIGAKSREGETQREMSKVQNLTETYKMQQEMNTRLQKVNLDADAEQKQNQAQADVILKKTELEKQMKLAAVEATKMAQIREAVLDNELHEKRVVAETAAHRSKVYSLAVVKAEVSNQEASARLFQAQRDAEATLYAEEKKAAAILINAEAQAKAIRLIAEAEAAAAQQMIEAMGSGERYLAWKVLGSGLYESLAKSNADAVQGLKPKIALWQMGAGGGAGGGGGLAAGGENDASKMIAGLCSVVPPLFSTIEQQTGMQLLPGLVKSSRAEGQK